MLQLVFEVFGGTICLMYLRRNTIKYDDFPEELTRGLGIGGNSDFGMNAA